MKSAGLLGLAAAAAEGRAGEPGQDEEYVPALGAPKGYTAEVVDPATLLPHLTDDKLVANVQFGQDLQALSVDLSDGQANSLTRVATVEVPVKVPPTNDDEAKKFFGFLAVVRGDVVKDKYTRVAVVLDLGGKVHVREYPFGEERNGSIEERCFSFPASDHEVTTTQETVIQNGKEVTVTHRTSNYVTAPPHFTAVLTVSVQRRSPDSAARVSIEEMDLSIIQPKPPTPGGAAPQPGPERSRRRGTGG